MHISIIKQVKLLRKVKDYDKSILDKLEDQGLVQVTDNNSCKCCDSPTILQFVNTEVAWTGDVNVVVTKIC